MGQSIRLGNVDVYMKTLDNGGTLMFLKDKGYKRAVDILSDIDGVITEITVHGHDEKEIDICNSSIKTKTYKGHAWRTLNIDDLSITLHNTRKMEKRRKEK